MGQRTHSNGITGSIGLVDSGKDHGGGEVTWNRTGRCALCPLGHSNGRYKRGDVQLARHLHKNSLQVFIDDSFVLAVDCQSENMHLVVLDRDGIVQKNVFIANLHVMGSEHIQFVTYLKGGLGSRREGDSGYRHGRLVVDLRNTHDCRPGCMVDHGGAAIIKRQCLQSALCIQIHLVILLAA